MWTVDCIKRIQLPTTSPHPINLFCFFNAPLPPANFTLILSKRLKPNKLPYSSLKKIIRKAMTEHDDEQVPRQRRRRCCLVATGVAILMLLAFFIIILILALTVFKPKQPITELQSAKLDGIAPRVTFPAIDIQLNLTLDLQILVKNRNRASFKHGSGKSLLLYQGNQVGDVDIDPGLIPARGSAVLPCRLTLQVDEMASNLSALIRDVSDGELVMETRTRIPGRVNLLGIFKKHIVATSDCQFTFAILAFKIQSEKCKNKARY